MARKIYTAEEIQRYLEDSDVEDFSSGSDEEYQPDSADEESEDTEVIQNFIVRSDLNVSDPILTHSPGTSALDLENVSRDLPFHSEHTSSNLETEWNNDVLHVGREVFTGNGGVRNMEAITQDGTVNLIKIYENFLTNELIDEMIIHTNNYANLLKASRTAVHSRMNRWKDVSRAEMKIFFGIIMYMGINPKPSIEHYWKLDILYYDPLMHRINMSYNRFTSILRCWHFTEIQLGAIGLTRTHKIDPLVNKLVDNFRRIYTPSDVVVIDESMVKFHGKLIIKTYNPSKTDRYGMKIYKACTVNSYTWSYQIYAGVSSQLVGLDKPGSTIVKLIEPLLDEGRIIIADNYYTSVPLAQYLKNRRTDLCGTLRKNKRNLPSEVVSAKLRRGNYIARQKDNYLTVMKWRDKRDVLMITTCHGDSMSKVATRRGDVMKPDVIIDYNDAKKGIDIADQLSSFHNPLRKSLTWYKKIAIDILFSVAVINSRCIYNEVTGGSKLSVLQVQEQLVRHFLGPVASTKEVHCPARLSISSTSSALACSILSQHQLEELPRRQNKLVRKRCTGCYAKLKAQGTQAIRAKQVHTQCKQCQKAFCLDCFNEKHAD